MSTVVSIIAGVLLLGENFSAYQLIGVIIIITGVYIANAGEKENNWKNKIEKCFPFIFLGFSMSHNEINWEERDSKCV